MLTATALLLLTVLGTLSAGVLASYGILTGILYAFGGRRRQPTPAALQQSHASGD
jgi:hypothetical protein